MRLSTLPLLFAMTTGQIASHEPDLAELRPRLVQLMRDGVETRAPNHSLYPWGEETERESLFTGSYDWHSCVIAHWCLLLHARTAEDDALGAWLGARLTGEGLANEVQLLLSRASDHQRTAPYDEAWLFMLLSELERHPGAPEAIEAWRDELGSHLISRLEESPFPERGERGFTGDYRSWLMALLLVTWSEPASEDMKERLRALHETKLAQHNDRLAALSSAHSYDFLWLPAIHALAVRSHSGEAAPYDPGPLPELPEAVTVPTVHPLGVVISRTWTDAFDAGRGDAEAQKRYYEHLSHFLAREDLWAGDFDACSHWLPQYLWIGLWLSEGRP